MGALDTKYKIYSMAKQQKKIINQKFIAAVIVGLVFMLASNALADSIFLTLKAKKKTKNPDVTLKGRVGIGANVSISVNGVDIGPVSLDEKNKYHVRVPLEIGNNTVRVTASRDGTEKIIEKNIERKSATNKERPLWVTIIYVKNRIEKPDVAVRGKAYDVSEVSISVNGEPQGTAEVSAKTGKFKYRVILPVGVSEIRAEAVKGLENVTATKRVRRLK